MAPPQPSPLTLHDVWVAAVHDPLVLVVPEHVVGHEDHVGDVALHPHGGPGLHVAVAGNDEHLEGLRRRGDTQYME